MRNYAMLLPLFFAVLLLGCIHEGAPAATPTPAPTATQAPATPTPTPVATVEATTEATPTPTVAAPANEIRIKNYKFISSRITVKKGVTLTWVNDDQAKHTVTRDAGYPAGPESALLAQGESYSYTFQEKGIYAYHCDPHPYMKAIVEVVE